MPEIKHNFLQGKMNKDLDERLVPNGQYRDALNIEISTSEASDVGALQNILGNKLIPTLPHNMVGNPFTGTYNSECIGSIADEKNDALYYFISSESYEEVLDITTTGTTYQGHTGYTVHSHFIDNNHLRHDSLKDLILEYKDDQILPVFVDKHSIIIKIWDTETMSSQMDVAMAMSNYSMGVSSGFINQGIGWGYNASTQNKIEVMDITGLKVGYTVKGVGTKYQSDAGFIDFFDDGDGVLTEIINIQPVPVTFPGGLPIPWVDSTGVTRQQGIITLNKVVYPSPAPSGSANENITHLVFEKNILDFSKDRLITGINIIDDMLFWTDNFSEPKKINITRGKEGTDPLGDTPTKLIVEDNAIYKATGINAEQEHITVIKKSPTSAPKLEMKANRSGYSFGVTNVNYGNASIGDATELEILPFTGNNLHYEVGDTLLLKLDITNVHAYAELRNGSVEHDVRVLIDGIYGNFYSCTILNIHSGLQFMSFDFGVILDETAEELFSLKFPRFALRYKYEDGEYSSYGPFSDIAFITDLYDFFPNKGYNLGMVNQLRELTLRNIIPPDIPLDVIQVDILYKETNSPSIYVVEQIKMADTTSYWQNDSYRVTSEVIYAVLPSNQLLRPWDNVPRKALAQEIIGNRLVFANYLQNYNLRDSQQHLTTMDFSVALRERDYFKQSIKSMRTYQLGVVYRDVYGRETPVQTNSTGSIKVSKLDADKTNRITTTIKNKPPAFADSYKIFVKETSSEYYNLPLDRLYDAEDGNVWLSFASHDRNKVKDEDTLILKKGLDSGLVTDVAKYKILGIENEAPNFIKTRKSVIGDASMTNVVWTPATADAANLSMRGIWPLKGYREFFITGSTIQNTPLENFHRKMTEEGVKAAPLYVRFYGHDAGGFRNQYTTDWYEIDTANKGGDTDGSGPSGGDDNYRITVKRDFDDDTLWINSSGSFLLPTLTDASTNGNLVVQIAQRVENEEAKFQGRFFVKVIYDTTIKDMIVNPQEFHAVTRYAIDAYYVKDFTQEDPVGGATYDASAHATAIADFNVNGPSGKAINGVYTHTGSIITGNSNVQPFKCPTGYSYAFENKPEWQTGMSGRVGAGNCWGDYNNLDMAIPATFDIQSRGGANQVTTFDNAIFDYWTPSLTQGDLWKPNGVPIPEDAYYSKKAWSKIKNKLKAAGSKWFIDEAFATAEEPYWGVGVEQNPLAVSATGWGGSNQPSYTNGSHTLYLGWGLWSSNRHQSWNKWSGTGLGIKWPIGVQAGTYPQSLDDTIHVAPRPDYVGLTFRYHVDGAFTLHDKKIYGLGYSPHDPQTPDTGGSGNTNNDYNLYPYPPIDTKYTNTLAPTHAMYTTNPVPSPQDLTDSMVDWMFYSVGQGISGSEIDISCIAPTEESEDGDNTSVLGWNSGKDRHGHSKYNVAEGASTFLTSENDNKFISELISGAYIVFTADPQRRVYKLLSVKKFYKRNYAAFLFDDTYPFAKEHYDYQNCSQHSNHPSFSSGCEGNNKDQTKKMFNENYKGENFRVTYRLTLDQPIGFNNYTPLVSGTINDWYGVPTSWDAPTINTNPVGIEIVNLESLDFGFSSTGEVEFPDDPAVWETEPEETAELDIYYEASEVIPLKLNAKNNELFAPIGSKIGLYQIPWGGGITGFVGTIGGMDFGTPEVISWNGNEVTMSFLANEITMDYLTNMFGPQKIMFIKKDGSYITGLYDGLGGTLQSGAGTNFSYTIKIKENLLESEHGLTWHNCYSFGNGVESDRIRDNFNAVTLDNGVRASATFEEKFEEERRGSGLIYSGLYNSTSGINNLNQFIQAEKITKDLNPTYGTIQKLHSRNTDLIALCEDKVLKILANKDAVYNADNNMQLTATQNVLGQSIPFIGEFGISKNPESFASESYRVYFTDKQRGAVLRLSMDGLTNIAEHGMSDWFKDNLRLGKQLIGSHDDRKEDYNITIKTDDILTTKTLSFSEIVRGWTSFKSFIPDNGMSMASNYYTFKGGRLYRHHEPQKKSGYIWVDCAFENANNYNVFYGVDSYNTTVDVMLNDAPNTIKSFKTLGYEGSQSKVDNFTTTTVLDAAGNTLGNIGDGEFYNIEPDKKGWFVSSIVTDQQKGSIKEFIEKEGLWDNYIIGEPKTTLNIDPEEFSFQGIGISGSLSSSNTNGCTDPSAWNYNPLANLDDGSCIDSVVGCMTFGNSNYNPSANTPCNSCCYIEGCMDATMWNYNPLATVDDGSCAPFVYGCTDQNSQNYNANANTDDGSCGAFIYGCMDSTAMNWNPTANTDDGGCQYCVYGCMDSGNMGQAWWDDFNTITTGMNDGIPYSAIYFNLFGPTYPASPAINYNPWATCDDGNCVYTSPGGIAGCMDALAENYDCSSNVNPGSIVPCNDGVTVDDGSCVYAGCTVSQTAYSAQWGLSIATNYCPTCTIDDGSCIYPGCTDNGATNYDIDATVDDGTCTFPCNSAVITVNANISPAISLNGAPDTNGSIILSATGTSTPYTYDWYVGTIAFGNSNQVPLGTTGDPHNNNGVLYASAGDYHVIVTDTNGCTEMFDYTMTSDDFYSGCTDANAINFDFVENLPNWYDDGSCYGCRDIMGPNYCAGCPNDCANQPNGFPGDTSCCGWVYGCTNPLATNYDPLATNDDGSCILLGCTDSTANNAGIITGTSQTGANTDDGSCEWWGCTALGNAYYGCPNAPGGICTHDCNGDLFINQTTGWDSCCLDCSPYNWTITLDGDDPTTPGGTDGKVYITASSPSGPFSWQVLVDANGTTYGAISLLGNSFYGWDNLPEGTYTVTSSLNTAPPECTQDDTFTLTDPLACNLTIGCNTGGCYDFCSQTIYDLNVAGGVGVLSYVATYSDGSTLTGTFTNGLNSLAAFPSSWAEGNVVIVVTDSGIPNCTATITVPVWWPCSVEAQYGSPDGGTTGGWITTSLISCSAIGASDGQAYIEIVSATNLCNGYTIDLIDQATSAIIHTIPNFIPGASLYGNNFVYLNQHYTGLAAGTYEVHIQDNDFPPCQGGASSVFTFTIIEPVPCCGVTIPNMFAGPSGAGIIVTPHNALNGANGSITGFTAGNANPNCGGAVNTWQPFYLHLQGVSGNALTYNGGVVNTLGPVPSFPNYNNNLGMEVLNLPDGDYEYYAEDSNFLGSNSPDGCYSPVYTITVGNDITGCMDPAGYNYNAAAISDDGSCLYDCGINSSTQFTWTNMPTTTDEDCSGNGSLTVTAFDPATTNPNILVYELRIQKSGGGYFSSHTVSPTQSTYIGGLSNGVYNIKAWQVANGAGNNTFISPYGTGNQLVGTNTSTCYIDWNLNLLPAVFGCTDANAGTTLTTGNYDPLAGCEDGTCCYNFGNTITMPSYDIAGTTPLDGEIYSKINVNNSMIPELDSNGNAMVVEYELVYHNTNLAADPTTFTTACGDNRICGTIPWDFINAEWVNTKVTQAIGAWGGYLFGNVSYCTHNPAWGFGNTQPSTGDFSWMSGANYKLIIKYNNGECQKDFYIFMPCG